MDVLNQCLRSELSAIETYRQALDKFRAEHGQAPEFRTISQFLADHEDAANRLREQIRQQGGTPTDDSGAWGTWAKTVMGAAKLFGDKAALKALKEGEQSGIEQYDGLDRSADATPAARQLATTLRAKNQQHIVELDRLMQTA